MSLDRADKLEVIKEFSDSEKNVGTTVVQIGLLSKRIENLSVHMEKTPKDNHSRRGLVRLVAKRRKLLNYLKRTKPEKYGDLISKIGLRK
ncbi:MAG: 30S ribosomal protein S15 [Thermodesulfobacteriota bacterium]